VEVEQTGRVQVFVIAREGQKRVVMQMARAERALKGVAGKRLTYRTTN
jgi:hypothetical protein